MHFGTTIYIVFWSEVQQKKVGAEIHITIRLHNHHGR